jgi:hypothetical protein
VEYDELPQEIAEQLPARGLDLSCPREFHFFLFISHFFLFISTEEAAEDAASILRDANFEAEVIPSDEAWLCLAARTFTPSTDNLRIIAAVLRGLHRDFGAEFDGWEVELGC